MSDVAKAPYRPTAWQLIQFLLAGPLTLLLFYVVGSEVGSDPSSALSFLAFAASVCGVPAMLRSRALGLKF